MTESQRQALDLARGVEADANGLSRLALACGEDEARWAVGMWELRRRGRAKFSRADEMVFTREGLEMATHESVARWRASLIPAGVPVHDLTCGIGADLLAMAVDHPVTGTDLNPEHVAMARFNLAALVLSGLVEKGDALACPVEPGAWLYADPARRSGRQKFHDPSDYQPSIEGLVERLRAAPGGLLKLSPMLRDDFLEGLGGEVRFVSFGRECREALVLFGMARTDLARAAVRAESGAVLAGGMTDPRPSPEPMAKIFSMDPASIRAHALSGLGLGSTPGWLTAEAGSAGEWGDDYELAWAGPWRQKDVELALRDLNARVDAVKIRGFKEDASAVQSGFKAKGTIRLTLFLYQDGNRRRAILASRAASP